MFGWKAKNGINTYLPLDSLTEIHTEKELKIILNENDNQVDNTHQVDNNIQHAKETATSISNIFLIHSFQSIHQLQRNINVCQRHSGSNVIRFFFIFITIYN